MTTSECCEGHRNGSHADRDPCEYEVSPEDLAQAVIRQGDVLNEVATIARKAKLSGNPGLSALGAEILTAAERVL